MRKRNIFEPGSNEFFPLSRSKFENFLRCPRCFYLDRRCGIEPPSGPPFSINSAVDRLLKKEFDHYRKLQQPHPLMLGNNINAIPYQDHRLEEWRENFKGIRVRHKSSRFELFGAVDDLWINPERTEILVVDYKATSKDGEVNIDADWQVSYKRQMEFYQWLLRELGLKVSNTGYFVYCNAQRNRETFSGILEFDIKVIPYLGDTRWIENALDSARRCLLADGPPPMSNTCAHCIYALDLNQTERKTGGGSHPHV